MTPDAAGRPERAILEPGEFGRTLGLYGNQFDSGDSQVYAVRLERHDAALRSECTRLRAEIEALKDAVLAVYVGHHFCRLAKPERGIPAGTPCDVCIECANEMVHRALLAARKGEGYDGRGY